MKKKEWGDKIRYMFKVGAADLTPPADLGIQDSPLLTRLFTNTDLPTFFNTAFKSAIIIGAMLAVLRLGYAGFIYMTTDVWSSKQSATTIIQEAVLGLLLLLGVWLILNQINPNLLNLDILQSVRGTGT